MRLILKAGKYLLITSAILIAITFLSIPLARLESPGDLVPAKNTQPLAIDNVNVVAMTGEPLRMERQVLVRDGRIEDIVTAGDPIADDYLRIEGGGHYLMPGLFDMHVHAMDRKNLVRSLAFGVTSVRNMGGYPMHLRWKRELEGGEWLGSNLFTASPTMNGEKNANPLGQKIFTDPDRAREMVRRLHEQGWDFIKAYARLEVPVYEAILDEAGKLDFPVAGHVPYPVVEENYQLAAAMVTFEHTEDIFQGPLDYQYDDDLVRQIAAELKAMDATVTPTLMIFDHLTQIARDKQGFIDDYPMQYVNPMMKFFVDRTAGKRWLTAGEKLTQSLERRNDYFRFITRVLYDNDVKLVLGTDWGAIYALPGSATHDEIEILHETGIPARAILEMATVNAAEVLRVDDEFGTIEPGKVADMILSRDNPMTDLSTLRQPAAVIKNGQWLDRNALAMLDESAKNPSNIYLTTGRVLEFVLTN